MMLIILLIPHVILKKLNIKDTSNLEINSLGNIYNRRRYIKKLTQYLDSFKDQLSIDSKKRLIKNPLRILDSKSEKDIEILKNAPKLVEYLDDESKNNFKVVLEGLDNLSITYNINLKVYKSIMTNIF